MPIDVQGQHLYYPNNRIVNSIKPTLSQQWDQRYHPEKSEQPLLCHLAQPGQTTEMVPIKYITDIKEMTGHILRSATP
jgi:hypothetical protein